MSHSKITLSVITQYNYVIIINIKQISKQWFIQFKLEPYLIDTSTAACSQKSELTNISNIKWLCLICANAMCILLKLTPVSLYM